MGKPRYKKRATTIMTNIEMLCEGIQHIANNHGFKSTIDYEEDDEVCIYGGCNVPTLADVHFLCDDLHIERNMIESSEFGIDVFLSQEWWDEYANEEYQQGMEFWRRVA